MGFCGSPAKDVGWAVNAARVCCRADRIEPADQSLIKIISQRQWPASDLFEGLACEGEAGVKAAGGVFFLDLASVVAEDFGRFEPEMAFHGRDMAADVMSAG